MKTGKRKRRFYWDTNVFIAWLKNETIWPPSVIVGMEDVAREVTDDCALLFTSTITNAEIFQGTLKPAEKQRFQMLMQRSNVHQVALDVRIADRASQIREWYNPKGIKIKTPDATHLATAILYKADEFQTMDGLKDDGKKNKLLALSGNVAGSPLHIVNPYPLQIPPDELVKVKGPLFTPSTLIQ